MRRFVEDSSKLFIGDVDSWLIWTRHRPLLVGLPVWVCPSLKSSDYSSFNCSWRKWICKSWNSASKTGVTVSRFDPHAREHGSRVFFRRFTNPHPDTRSISGTSFSSVLSRRRIFLASQNVVKYRRSRIPNRHNYRNFRVVFLRSNSPNWSQISTNGWEWGKSGGAVFGAKCVGWSYPE